MIATHSKMILQTDKNLTENDLYNGYFREFKGRDEELYADWAREVLEVYINLDFEQRKEARQDERFQKAYECYGWFHGEIITRVMFGRDLVDKLREVAKADKAMKK